MSLQKGLVGHWPLDRESLQSATIFADKTPQENRGTSANAPVFTTDRMGQADRAMSFDGASDYVDCGDDASLDITKSITLSMWIYPISWKDEIASSFIVRRTGATGYFFFRLTSSESVTIDFGGNQNRWDTGYDLPLNTWTLLTYTFDSVNKGRFYVNGALNNTTELGIGISDNALLIIGKNEANNSYFWEGSIADVRIYNRALSETEITMLYDMYRPKLSAGSLQKGLVLDMPLNTKRYNAGNSKFDDLTPYENRGVNTGGDVDTDHTTFIAANSDNVRIPDSESLSPTSAMTVMVWVKGAAQGGKGFLTHYDSGINQRSFMMLSHYASPYNTLTVYLSGDGTINISKKYTSSIVAFDNTYHLIGFSFDAGTLKLYIDGVEDPNPTKIIDDTLTVLHNSTADIMIGSNLHSDTPTAFFDGDISGTKMWNRALTNAEWLLAFEQTAGKFL